MKVLVTGGTGFIGRRIVAALLERGTITTSGGEDVAITKVLAADIAEPQQPMPDDPRLETTYGDFSGEGAAAALVDADTAAVFHLAAIVSGEAEQDFDKGMRVNLDGARRLLDACRALGTRPRVVFASSVAVYGGDMPDVIEDDTPITPQTSYGAQKMICEYLIGDYSRKGFIDGRALRLPTIVVRPGRPNAAASSFASSILREPLQGVEVTCPVGADTGVWVLSPRQVVKSFLHAEALPEEAWGFNRGLFLPGMTVSVGDMIAALRDVAGDAVAARVRFEPDPFIERIVYGWPTRFAPRRGESMGFEADRDLRDVIRAFVEDDLGGDYVA